MKFLTLITLATAALAAVGDKYHLMYKKKGDELFPVSWDGEILFASGYGTPITVTEGVNQTLSVEGRNIEYFYFLAEFWTGDPEREGLKAGSKWNMTDNGDLRDISIWNGPTEYYFCSPGPPKATIWVRTSPDWSRCRGMVHLTFHLKSIDGTEEKKEEKDE